MKRTPLIAGNWKMNKTESESISLVRKLMQQLEKPDNVEVLICPPYTSLSQLHKLLVSSPIMLGAQNISEKSPGAFTGEISAQMVAEFCTHVILGHSERRAYYQETDSTIQLKFKAAQQVGLIPVLCVGEKLSERESGLAATVISRQIKDGLKDIYLDDPQKLIIAYEPVWAIGSGISASAEETAELVGGVIRPVLSGLWDEEIAQGIRVLYGGSVKPSNARSFFSQEDIDGALVGGASLKVDDFLGIIESVS